MSYRRPPSACKCGTIRGVARQRLRLLGNRTAAWSATAPTAPPSPRCRGRGRRRSAPTAAATSSRPRRARGSRSTQGHGAAALPASVAQGDAPLVRRAAATPSSPTPSGLTSPFVGLLTGDFMKPGPAVKTARRRPRPAARARERSRRGASGAAARASALARSAPSSSVLATAPVAGSSPARRAPLRRRRRPRTPSACSPARSVRRRAPRGHPPSRSRRYAVTTRLNSAPTSSRSFPLASAYSGYIARMMSRG